MSRSWHFPRWRHILMQSVMWLVLAASVGVAALLDRHLIRAQIVDLGPEIVDAPVTFQLPATWKTWTNQGEGDAAGHFAKDSDPVGGVQRTVAVVRQHVNKFMSPGEYINRIGPPPRRHLPFGPATIGGWPAQEVAWEATTLFTRETGENQYTMCAAAVFPGNEAVLVRLDKSEPFSAADERLFRQIIDSVKISLPAPTAGGSFELLPGSVVKIPPEDLLYPQPDILTARRTVVHQTPAGAWESAQFFPIIMESDAPSLQLLSAISAREQMDARDPSWTLGWLKATISREPTGWKIDPKDPPNLYGIERKAHIFTSPANQAILVILNAQEAPEAADADLETFWNSLSAGITAGPTIPLAPLLSAGQSLNAQGQFLLWKNQWWLWSGGSTPVGFSHDFANPSNGIPARQTLRRNWNGTATAILQLWGPAGARNPTEARIWRSDAERDPNSRFIPLADGSTLVGTTIDTTSAVRDEVPVGTKVPLNPPDTFILSQRLPELLSSIGPQPVAFMTDRFPGIEAERLAGPILITARQLPSEGSLKVIEAQVNGSGEFSRWYFAANGSVDHADFAGDLHLRASSEAEIEGAFAGDRRLTTQPQ